MDEGDDFDYNGLDAVVFDEEVAGSPGRPGEVVVAAATAAYAYGSDYESDDLATRKPGVLQALLRGHEDPPGRPVQPAAVCPERRGL